MNIWANSVITQKGLNLQAKLIQGTTLNITRAVTGSGFVTPGLLQQQTAVSGEKQTLTFQTVTYPEQGKCKLPCHLNNDELTTGYTAMQVGVYALDPDEGEILYFIVQAEANTGTVIPAQHEVPGYSAEWNFYFQYGQADAVTVEVDPSNVATTIMLENKADRDFANVTNVIFLEKAIISGAAIPIVYADSNDGVSYTASVPGMTVSRIGMTFIMIPRITSTTTMPTLNVNNLGVLNLRQQLSLNLAGTAPGAIDTWLSANKPCLVTYDGELWKVDIARPVASGLYGSVPIENGGTEGTTVEEARENLGAASQSELEQLKSAIYEDIKGNPHTIDFVDLEGLIVTGIWNEAKARMEC